MRVKTVNVTEFSKKSAKIFKKSGSLLAPASKTCDMEVHVSLSLLGAKFMHSIGPVPLNTYRSFRVRKRRGISEVWELCVIVQALSPIVFRS